MAVIEVGRYIVIDPEIAHGKMTFRGTRIPVETALLYIAKGDSVSDIVRQWPQIAPEAVQEAVRLACAALHQQYEADLTAARTESRRLREEWVAREATGAEIASG